MTPDDLPASDALLKLREGSHELLALWRSGVAYLPEDHADFDSLLKLSAEDFRGWFYSVEGGEVDLQTAQVLAPVDSQEVWGAGVTYERSRDARIEESDDGDVYTRVYQAERPEVFYKSAGHRVVGPDEPVGIRSDSEWNVPEPELAVLVNRHGEVVAYSVGDDVSSRSIEGANPLYLPQAKIYDRSCAIGPAAVLAWGVQPGEIRLKVHRNGELVSRDAIHPNSMVRPVEDLVAAVRNWYELPHGFWLLTGTGIVPSADFTLHEGDTVSISVEGVGRLRNPVVAVGLGVS